MPLAEGFEEIEAVNVIDILRRADVDVVTAGLKEGLVEGSHKIKVLPDTTLEKIDYRDFDGLVLPGGAPGFVNLGNDERILNMAREMDRAGKIVAAICAAPSVLIKAGVLQGRRATVSPSGKAQVEACANFQRGAGGGGRQPGHQPLAGNGSGVRLEAGGGAGGKGEDDAGQGADDGHMPGGLREFYSKFLSAKN